VPIKVNIIPYGFMGPIHAVPGAGIEPKQLAAALGGFGDIGGGRGP
jgi:hypothetical protein